MRNKRRREGKAVEGDREEENDEVGLGLSLRVKRPAIDEVSKKMQKCFHVLCFMIEFQFLHTFLCVCIYMCMHKQRGRERGLKLHCGRMRKL